MTKAPTYTIEPKAELNGEGCGWDLVDAEKATIFVVYENAQGMNDDKEADYFNTLAEAQAAYPAALIVPV